MVAESRPRYASDAHGRIFPRCAYCASLATTTREGTRVCDEHRRHYDAGLGLTAAIFAGLTGYGVMYVAGAWALGLAYLPAGAFLTLGSGLIAGRAVRALWRRDD